MKMELFPNFFNAGLRGIGEHFRRYAHAAMLSDLQLVYMVPRKSTQLLNINTTKFQVEREPVYITS